jgi:hypothetical protein
MTPSSPASRHPTLPHFTTPFRLHSSPTTNVLYAPNARALWLAKDQRAAGIYDARTLEPLRLLPTGMLPLALSADGQRVAVSVDAQRLQLWNLRALREQFRDLGMDWADGAK